MRLVYAHFPINAIPNEDGSAIQIRNFRMFFPDSPFLPPYSQDNARTLTLLVGEKYVRDCQMLEGVKVSISDVKDEIIIQGNDIEKVSQSAASITDKTRVKDKDIRKFLGAYSLHKFLQSEAHCVSHQMACTPPKPPPSFRLHRGDIGQSTGFRRSYASATCTVCSALHRTKHSSLEASSQILAGL